jgi:hypothetical protein
MQAAPATRYKTFELTTATTWSAGRQGSVSSPGKPELTVASPAWGAVEDLARGAGMGERGIDELVSDLNMVLEKSNP